MSQEREITAMHLCNEFVNLFNLDTKHKFDLIDKIGYIYKIGEEYERLERKEELK